MISPAIEITQLRYAYPDGTLALDGIDLTVPRSERLGLIGANGAGKSTVLLHLNGILRGDGQVRIFGVPVTRANLATVRQSAGLVFQNPDDQLFCPTVYDDVAFGPRNLRLPNEEVERRVTCALQAVGIPECAPRSAFHLSFGQKKRAAIATVLAMDVQLLVLDEPSSNLDPRGRRELVQLLTKLGGTRIIATHDLDLVKILCSRVVLLDKGRIAADGTPDRILADTDLLQAHGL